MTANKRASLSKAAALLDDCILDGELCAVNANDEPDFSALRRRLNRKMSGRLAYFVFDILWCDTGDVRLFALRIRKKMLEAGGEEAAKRIRYVAHFQGIATSEFSFGSGEVNFCIATLWGIRDLSFSGRMVMAEIDPVRTHKNSRGESGWSAIRHLASDKL